MVPHYRFDVAMGPRGDSNRKNIVLPVALRFRGLPPSSSVVYLSCRILWFIFGRDRVDFLGFDFSSGRLPTGKKFVTSRQRTNFVRQASKRENALGFLFYSGLL